MSEKDKKDKKGVQDNKGKKPKKGRFDFEFNFNFYWVYVIIAVAFIAMTFLPDVGQGDRTLSSSDFKEMILDKDVSELVVINREVAEIYIETEALENNEKYKEVKERPFGSTLNPGPHYFYQIGDLQNFEKSLQDWQKDFPIEEKVDVRNETRKNWGGDFLMWILPFALIIGVWIFLMKRMSGGAGGGAQIFNIGKSKAQLFEGDTTVNVTFDDVAGLDEAKVEIKEIVDFLRSPKKYTDLGAKIPKGALLVGPPGTG